MSTLFINWSFNIDENPFNEATNSREVRQKKRAIEDYVQSSVSDSWDLDFEWSVIDIGYNLIAYISPEADGINANTSVGTPQPPPQPPPPNL